MIRICASFVSVLLFSMGSLGAPMAAHAAAVYQLQVIAKPATLYPTEGQKGRIDWTVTNSSYDLAIPGATLDIQLLSFPPGALTAKPVYSGKVDPNNQVTDLKILNGSTYDGRILLKGESINFVETFATRDARSPAPLLNSVGVWNINTTVEWKRVDTGTTSKTTTSSSVTVVDPRIATDISGGTTFETPTAPASGLGIKSANVISYGWSFNVSQPGKVTALGFWDEGPAGLASDHTVALWSTAGGAPLAMVTVKSDSPSYQSAQSGGGWVFVTLPDELKLPVGSYVLGADYVSASPDALRISTPTSPLTLYTHPFVTFSSSRESSTWGSGLKFPDQPIPGEVGRFGPNLLFSSGIPEPSTWLLMSVGISALWLRQRYTPLASGHQFPDDSEHLISRAPESILSGLQSRNHRLFRGNNPGFDPVCCYRRG